MLTTRPLHLHCYRRYTVRCSRAIGRSSSSVSHWFSPTRFFHSGMRDRKTYDWHLRFLGD